METILYITIPTSVVLISMAIYNILSPLKDEEELHDEYSAKETDINIYKIECDKCGKKVHYSLVIVFKGKSKLTNTCTKCLP